ncbi:MAG: hypothetical protein KKH41_05050 [Candidatus Thermoplasmatota archaeon]|nr:hypothetical protein [Euryarchaeota archaeon]MBU4031677.1 hypothetical protein [Candidatus Thermoplasmatota archaeon]MBU4070957.1 hypothetical protein [Candidatus Thermoplasmatota archaeon]MBU4144338.1 hypothetical protein [Candidatus Thermoplasmatota archaeon]MBU4591934.1 hypothetical protein [Candidatus Thermoplasmatota archaeon]
MGKKSRNKRRKPQPSPAKEPEEEVEETGEEVEEPETEATELEITEAESTPPTIKKTLLFIGIVFSAIGLMGVAGLRTGLVQWVLGDSDPFPGVGSVEPMGHVVSMLPLIIGILFIGFWGIKNDSIYVELEKIKEAGETIPAEDEEISEPEEPVEEIVEDILDEDFEETIDMDTLTPEKIPDEFNEPFADLEQELEVFEDFAAVSEEPVPTPESPEMTSPEVKSDIAETLRVERCEKMLTAVVILPDDKERLKMLIEGGVSPNEFTEEIKKAVDRRKKKETDREVTADEKASILEDELVAELAELEENLDDGGDSEDLEDEILREIEDLEGL